MEPITPPASYRALRPAGRRQNVSDLPPKSAAAAKGTGTFSKLASSQNSPEVNRPPSRGRARFRKTDAPRLTLPLGSELSVSRNPRLRAAPLSPLLTTPVNEDEELLFQMSPVKAQSSSSLFRDPKAYSVDPEPQLAAPDMSLETLAAIWKGHGLLNPRNRTRGRDVSLACAQTTYGATGYPFLRGRQQSGSPVRLGIPIKRPPGGYSSRPCNVASPSDRMGSPRSPLSPGSPEMQFMYTFPAFESSPLAKARHWRARRLAGVRDDQYDFKMPNTKVPLSGSPSLEGVNEPVIRQPHHDVNESLKDATLISAFQSCSLDEDAPNSYSYPYDEKVPNSDTTESFTESGSALLSSSLLSSFPLPTAPLPPIVNNQIVTTNIGFTDRPVKSELDLLAPHKITGAEVDSVFGRGLRSAPLRVRVEDAFMRVDDGNCEQMGGRERPRGRAERCEIVGRRSWKVKTRQKTPAPDVRDLLDVDAKVGGEKADGVAELGWDEKEDISVAGDGVFGGSGIARSLRMNSIRG